VVKTTTANLKPVLEHVVDGPTLLAYQRLVRSVPVSDHVARYALRLVRQTRPTEPGASEIIRKSVSYGASVRAAQYLVLGGKARALMRGRYHVTVDDIRALAHPVLRHRVLTNFFAESEGITSDDLVDWLLETVRPPSSDL
jgi:MoxR-like ATPase